MDQIPLVNDQIEAGRKVVQRLQANGIPILAAGWVKESDLWDWYLYLVTPLVDEDGAKTRAYRRIFPAIRSGPQPPEVDPFRVKAVGPAEPKGRAILDAQRQGRRPWEFGGGSLGGVSVDAVYLYPPIVADGQKE